MEKFNKVLRQLPEGVVRWLLQEFMKDGVPTEIESVLINHRELMPDTNFHLKISGEFLMYGSESLKVGIYNLKENRPNYKAVKYQDPTPEQVKAIYEGVEKVNFGVEDIARPSNVDELDYEHYKMLGKIYNSKGWVLFQKSKGFALPISWKEEEERTNIGKCTATYSNLEDVLKTNVDTKEGWVKLFESLDELEKRVTKLEQKEQPVKEQHATKEVDSGDGEKTDFCINEKLLKGEVKLHLPNAELLVDGKPVKESHDKVYKGDMSNRGFNFIIGELYQQLGTRDIFICVSKGRSKKNKNFTAIRLRDGYKSRYNKNEFIPYTLPNKGEIV